MSSLQSTSKQSVSVPFEVELEIHNRSEFQKEGHFVCGLKDWPNNPTIERPWRGDLLYLYTFLNPHGWSRKTQDIDGNISETPFLFRAMSDSPEDAARILSDAIRSYIVECFMLQQSSRAADENAAQLRKDFEAVKVKLDSLSGPGSSAASIREARIAEMVG